MDWHQLPRPQKSMGFYCMSVAAAGGYKLRIPIYGTRTINLPSIDRVVYQVLVEAFGGFCWINVDRSDCEFD